MNVPHAEGKAVERFEAQNLTVSAGDHDVAAERFKRGDFLAELCGLKYGDSGSHRHLLHRGRHQLHAPTLGAVRLCVDAHHVEAVGQNFFQAGRRDVRRTHKHNTQG